MKRILARRLMGPVLALSLLALPGAAGARPSFLVAPARVSGSSPFAGCDAVNPPSQGAESYLNAEVEPSVAADPLTSGSTLDLVGVWQQDRWAAGAHGL